MLIPAMSCCRDDQISGRWRWYYRLGKVFRGAQRVPGERVHTQPNLCMPASKLATGSRWSIRSNRKGLSVHMLIPFQNISSNAPFFRKPYEFNPGLLFCPVLLPPGPSYMYVLHLLQCCRHLVVLHPILCRGPRARHNHLSAR